MSQLFDIEFVTDAEPVVYRANNALQRILEATPNLEEVLYGAVDCTETGPESQLMVVCAVCSKAK